MVIFDTFAKRKRALERASQPDVYIYDTIPPRLRNQLIHLFKDAIGVVCPDHHTLRRVAINATVEGRWRVVYDIFVRELGVQAISPDQYYIDEKCLSYLLQSNDIDEVFSLIELCCVCIDKVVNVKDAPEGMVRASYIKIASDCALNELNERFKENSIGYEYCSGKLISINSQFVHKETVLPALRILQDKIFGAASDDFLKAHEHFRSGNYKDSIVSANRSFEATMKAVCEAKGWGYPSGARASDLIALLIREGIIPLQLSRGLESFVAMMKTGLPALRNAVGGHGQGSDDIEATANMAEFALHLSASNIVFIGKRAGFS